jgi:hypothetical protein
MVLTSISLAIVDQPQATCTLKPLISLKAYFLGEVHIRTAGKFYAWSWQQFSTFIQPATAAMSCVFLKTYIRKLCHSSSPDSHFLVVVTSIDFLQSML